jgi:hypothetical protein
MKLTFRYNGREMAMQREAIERACKPSWRKCAASPPGILLVGFGVIGVAILTRPSATLEAESKRSGLQRASDRRARATSILLVHEAAGGPPKGNRNALKHGTR